MVKVQNAAGETVGTFASDAEAVRWWNSYGRSGDELITEDAETDGFGRVQSELMSDVAAQLNLED